MYVDLTDGFTPTEDTRDATIETARGAAVNFLTTDIQPHYVNLVAVNTSGIDSSPSPQRMVMPLEPDGGVHTYYAPEAPSDPEAGDLWVDSDDGNLMYRWDGSQWVSVRDDGINQAIQDADAAQQDAADAIAAASDAQATADGKVTTYYQGPAPTGAQVGDLWWNTGNDQLSRWNGSSWTQIQDHDIAEALADAATAQNTADAKIVSYFQATPPSGAAVGDLWFDTSAGNAQHWWDGDNWTSVPMGTGAIAGGAATTEILADGAATNAKLANEAVDDRVLKSLIALTSRLVAGDPTGARVELNGNGLEAYDASGTRTVYLASANGSASFTGTIMGSAITGSTFRTAASGARIEVGTTDAQTVSFYTDNDSRATMQQVTSLAGSAEYAGISLYSDTKVGAEEGIQSGILVNPLQLLMEQYFQDRDTGALRTGRVAIYGTNTNSIDPATLNIDMGDAHWSLGIDGHVFTTGGRFDWQSITPIGPASADGLFSIKQLSTGQAEIQCKVTISGLSNGDAIGQVPDWAIPDEFVTFPCFTNTGNQSRINVTAGGNIQLWTEAVPGNVTTCRFTQPYSPANLFA